MTDDAFGATVAKRRLSRLLTELRKDSGYTANQVCDRLNWGRGKVGRFEANQWVRPELSDIRDIARLYGQVDGDLAELERLASLARRRAWWREYAAVFKNEFCGFEADASHVYVLMPLVLPGLLQTQSYTQYLMAAGTRSAEWQRRAREARLRRQAILDRDDGTAPVLVAVITEASLMYRWGTRADRRAQFAHLAQMSRRPNIELRLLRFADGPHPGMATLVNIFDFPGDEPAMVYLENDVTIQEIDEHQTVEAYVEIFDHVREAAMSPTTTTDYLEKLTQTLE